MNLFQYGLVYVSDCCKMVMVTVKQQLKSSTYVAPRMHREIYTLESDLDNNGNTLYLSPNKDSEIVYDTDEQVWRIEPMDLSWSNTFLKTEQDSQASKKCPHDSSLTWMHVEDRDVGDISVECFKDDSVFDFSFKKPYP